MKGHEKVNNMTDTIESKAWDWSSVPENSWNKVSDEFLPVALRWQNLGKQTVLDIGCGRGRHALHLAEMGFKVTATDLSSYGIHQLNEQTRQKNLEGTITTLVCDMLDLPFKKGQFDCILAFHSVFHTDYRGLKQIIAKITDFLNDSGGLYITFNSKSNRAYSDPANERIDEYTIIKTQGFEKGIPHTHLEYKDVIDLLSGYKISKIQHIQDFYHRGDSYHYFVEAEKK
jgi:cyclopropane fatty-acyl-phospholipid synthase-like methyltransferase